MLNPLTFDPYDNNSIKEYSDIYNYYNRYYLFKWRGYSSEDHVELKYFKPDLERSLKKKIENFILMMKKEEKRIWIFTSSISLVFIDFIIITVEVLIKVFSNYENENLFYLIRFNFTFYICSYFYFF